MNNTKPLTPQLTVQQLALCLGCEAELYLPEWRYGPADYMKRPPNTSKVIITLDLLLDTQFYKGETIKPILRRLESITEEQWAELNQVDNTGLPQFYSTFIKNYSPEYVWTFTPKQFQWLLSKWFDLKLFPLGSYIIQN